VTSVVNRRIAVTAVAVATVAVGTTAVGTAGAAAKKNEIRIVGGTVFKAGKFFKDDVRFTPANLSIKSGATLTVRDKGRDPAPHSFSLIKKAFLPKGFEFAGMGPLLTAHQVDPANEEAPPAVIKVDNGAAAADQNAPLALDSPGDDKQAGDSQFLAPGFKTATFKVTARRGAKLFYYCAFHPWMQGKISVK
jgi:plastocyanin